MVSSAIAFGNCWRSENLHAVLSASKQILMLCIVGIQSIKTERTDEWEKAQD